MAFTALDVQNKIAELSAADTPFEMKEFTVSGETRRGFASAPADLVQLLQAGRAHGDKPFIVYEGSRLTFDDFFQAVDKLGNELRERYNIQKGDRVAIAMRNCPQWSIAFVATVFCGAIAVPLNSWGKTDELVYGLEDCGASVLVCDPQRLALLSDTELGRTLPIMVADGDASYGAENVTDFKQVLAGASGEGFDVAQVSPDDPAMIMYTSGSTGMPKGTVHLHVGIAQALMNLYFVGYLTMSMEGPRELRGGAVQETPLLTVPLFHGTGLLSGLLVPLQMGQKVVLMYKWDSEKALQLIQEEKITGMTSVPAVLQALFTHPAFDDYDTSSLFRVGAAGAATPEALPALIESKLEKVSRSAGYAMTETMAVGTTMVGEIFDLNPEASGVKSPIADFRFIDSDGTVLPEGEIGEIQIRCITVCAGYWNRPEASAEIRDGEWLKTGDLGRFDSDGFLHITGRIKEIVIRGGENIYPGEIEHCAYAMEGIQEVVVFGVPDQDMGEELVLVAYPQESSDLTEKEIRARLTAKLAGFKVPRYIEIADSPLPQNASGKLFKRKIRDDYLSR
ncbi:MAG: class I adenylate-forming enzyme family protein [Halieaceae bacterium]